MYAHAQVQLHRNIVMLEDMLMRIVVVVNTIFVRTHYHQVFNNFKELFAQSMLQSSTYMLCTEKTIDFSVFFLLLFLF